MNQYEQIAELIIAEQTHIIGPIALAQAQKVNGLVVNTMDDIRIEGDTKDVITRLVEQYEKLFGKASVVICKEAIQPVMTQNPQTDLPDILKN